MPVFPGFLEIIRVVSKTPRIGLPVRGVVWCTCLAQVGGSDVVHVVKLHVLAAHCPDKGVVGSAYAAVDAPGGADDSVLVVHHDVAGLRGLAAHVEHHLPLGQFKVGVDLHPALMRVAGHSVPVGAGLQLGHAHAQLAGLEHVGVDELIDGALIAGLDAAQRTVICISHLDEAGLVRAMCRSGDHIELCRMLGVCGSKRNFPGTLGDIQAVLIAQLVLHTVGHHDARGVLADVEHTDLAALEEIVGAKVGPDVDALVDGDRLVDRHTAQRDHAVHMAVDSYDFIRLVQAGDEHLVAHLLGGVALEVFLVAGITDIHSGSPFLLSAGYGRNRRRQPASRPRRQSSCCSRPRWCASEQKQQQRTQQHPECSCRSAERRSDRRRRSHHRQRGR